MTQAACDAIFAEEDAPHGEQDQSPVVEAILMVTCSPSEFRHFQESNPRLAPVVFTRPRFQVGQELAFGPPSISRHI